MQNAVSIDWNYISDVGNAPTIEGFIPCLEATLPTGEKVYAIRRQPATSPSYLVAYRYKKDKWVPSNGGFPNSYDPQIDMLQLIPVYRRWDRR